MEGTIMRQTFSIGLIAAYLGSKILKDAHAGKPAAWMTKLADMFGGKKRDAIFLSYALGALGVWIGVRSLLSNQNYLGNNCGCGCNCGCGSYDLF